MAELDLLDHAPSARWRTWWPWLVILLTVFPAVWHVAVFPNDLDPEFPMVERPTFNRMPPPAYRLAEPGDTIDRVAIYLSAIGASLAAIGLLRSRGRLALWPAAGALALASLWYASTPGPTFDGWHGLGWRAIWDGRVPSRERLALSVAAIGLAAVVIANLVRGPRGLWSRARALKVRALLGLAACLVIARQFEVPGVEPVGYWPRWSFVWGVLAFDLALLRCVASQRQLTIRRRLAWTLAGAVTTAVLLIGGVWVSWYHRPLDRLREVDKDRLYISAMPTYRGLELAHDRHHFKTIINIFPEDTSQRSEILPDEHRFVREHGIRYIEASARDNDSDEFLEMCLGIARDPDSWPILLHCHGSMDRSPGWMGIYRFVVQGRPLDEILREIEVHRGYRPKASITLLYNRVLEPRAAERYRADPTATLLRACAHGVALVPYPPRKASTLSRVGDAPRRP